MIVGNYANGHSAAQWPTVSARYKDLLNCVLEDAGRLRARAEETAA